MFLWRPSSQQFFFQASRFDSALVKGALCPSLNVTARMIWGTLFETHLLASPPPQEEEELEAKRRKEESAESAESKESAKEVRICF